MKALSFRNLKGERMSLLDVNKIKPNSIQDQQIGPDTVKEWQSASKSDKQENLIDSLLQHPGFR
jgi:hypothetical protein